MNTETATDLIPMNSGYGIPCIGYGTWKTPEGKTAVDCVSAAIRSGYRHIDCAAVYGNEITVGEGIAKGLKEAGISREELFVTGKAWTAARGYDKVIEACHKSLQDLKLDYLDMYLIHWPMNARNGADWKEVNADTWRAMSDLKEQGYVKTIGVSNFLQHHLEALMESSDIVPAVNQIESHPGFYQKDLINYCQEKGILVEAYSPLGRGDVLTNSLIREFAAKYGHSEAHICIRWNLQHDIIPLPKSWNEQRMKDNLNVFDFEISEEDMKRIDNMELCGFSGLDPDTFDEV